MTKRQADRFLHWVYGWMKRRTVLVRFKFMDENTLAEIYTYALDDDLDIYDVPIDPSGPVLVSLLHEALHAKYPGKEESEIEDMTVKLVDHLTLRQWHNLFIRMGEVLILKD